ncbi:uncharacterized protein LOC121133760 [Mesocricetus auratus]|uniref:Uncharacterized protein LOC121133760 n=1 Tax=Mesocricetus auratus TaxID=10036 RepID=A0ABM2W756_MESAU|nr:uncharacterized protein LOC121133760 [Mesocricetus auratus]
MELSLLESREMSCSSVSDIVVQEVVPPCCYCKKGEHSADYSVSSGSSDNSSSLSYLPIFSEGAVVPVSSQKEPSMPSHSTPLPAFQLTDPEKSDLLQNLAVLPPLQAQSSFINSILESLDPCNQEKMKDKRKNRLLSDQGFNSVLNESPGPLVWAPLQLSPLVRGELEGHMSQKVSTLREQVIPLPVKKSWEILNRLMDVQGVPEQELPKTQLPTFIPQIAEQNTSRSPDVSSFHLHVNIGMNSELSRTEAKMSQPFTSNKRLQSEDDRQVLRYNPLVISMGTPSPRNLGVNIIQEETALLKRDPKHVLQLSIEQRVIGLPERMIQPHKAQVTNLELTSKIPRSATDSIKVTPLALLQVMDSMGMIPESHSEVMDSVGFSQQPPIQAETVSITPQPSNQVIESIKGTSPQHQTMETKSMVSRSNQVTDNMNVTPVALFHVMDSMGMINELHPHVESVGIAPKPQYQVMKPVKMETLHNHQAIGPGNTSLGPQHTVMETLNMTVESQNQVTKHIGITPAPINQNAIKISSTTQQTMDFGHNCKVSDFQTSIKGYIFKGKPQLISSQAPHITVRNLMKQYPVPRCQKSDRQILSWGQRSQNHNHNHGR